MAEEQSQRDLQSYSEGKDYAQYTVEGILVFVFVYGEPYVQPSLFMHILKSLKPGICMRFN